MRGLEQRVVGRLDIASALLAEATARNSVLPPQPGFAELAEHQSQPFAAWLASELRSGLRTYPRTMVNARKPRHGTRPAPIVPLPERVAYRAIVDFLLTSEPPLARTRDDYLSFVRGPVDYVMQKEGGIRRIALLLDDDEVKYVVKSDLSAFYEYIDHGLLGRALIGRARNAELVEHLLELLAELEGKSYGLPQMLDASDRLSEVYAQLIEDQLARRGYGGVPGLV